MLSLNSMLSSRPILDLMIFSNKGKPQRNAKSKSLQSNYYEVEWNIGNGQTLPHGDVRWNIFNRMQTYYTNMAKKSCSDF